MTAVINNLVAIICVFAGAYLAFHEINGWGWFLFIGALTANWGYTKNGSHKDSKLEVTEPLVTMLDEKNFVLNKKI